jgi:hypothetical protein
LSGGSKKDVTVGYTWHSLPPLVYALWSFVVAFPLGAWVSRKWGPGEGCGFAVGFFLVPVVWVVALGIVLLFQLTAAVLNQLS